MLLDGTLLALAHGVRLFLILLFAIGCSRSFSPSSSTDAGHDAADPVDDAGIDVVFEPCIPIDASIDAFVPDCTRWEYRGCSHSEHQWYWNGVECERILECADSGYASEAECEAMHAGCEPIDCGVPIELGSNELPATAVENAPASADVCRVGAGEHWLARARFTAPEDGTYRISSWPYIAWPAPIDIAVLRGGCGDLPLACGHEASAELRLQAGDVITILSKPAYDTEAPEFFGAMDVTVRLVD